MSHNDTVLPAVKPNDLRYSRQTLLPHVGPEGQARLTRARVAVVGVGGLGSPVALYLAAAGVGQLCLIDPDRVDVSNLQRQVIFDSSQQGQLKVEAARDRLTKLNPEVTVETHAEHLSAANALTALEDCDLVIDGTDNFSARFLVNDACTRLELPLVHGAVRAFEGRVALFWSAAGGACFRCLHPEPPTSPVGGCAEHGVLGSAAGVVGSLQATLALHFLISRGDPSHPLAPRIGELTLIDLVRGTFDRLTIPRRPDCVGCSPADVELVDLPQPPAPSSCSFCARRPQSAWPLSQDVSPSE
jgi:molybdopterin/thiamine biosynthesis adenylyltransferase